MALCHLETRACIPCQYKFSGVWWSHVFTSPITLSSSLNYHPQIAFFSGRKRWKSLTGPGCTVDGATQYSSFVTASLVCKLVCGLALSCKRRKSSNFFSGPPCCIQLSSLCTVATYTSELMVVPFSIMSTRITPFMYQKTVAINFPAEGTVLMFFHGEFMWCHSMDCCCLWLKVVNPCFITSHNSCKEVILMSHFVPATKKQCPCPSSRICVLISAVTEQTMNTLLSNPGFELSHSHFLHWFRAAAISPCTW